MLTAIDEQSPDIAQGVDNGREQREGGSTDEFDLAGAGDQGMMFGYATRETKALMPMPIQVAHQLARQLAEVRKAGVIGYLGPDGKTQVTVRYEHDRPVEIEKVLISTQHKEEAGEQMIRNDLWEHVVEPVLHADYKELFTEEKLLDNFLVNPTGKFVIGGPVGDAGLTGRKIIVDTYGGAARHGGGAFSGKDPSKVDRSAAYAARYVAKNVVAAGLADRCEVQVAYAIGVAHPVSVMVQTFGTGKLSDAEIARLVAGALRPAPGRIPQRPRPAPADLPEDRRLRPLRPRGRTTSPGSAPTAPRPCARRRDWKPARPPSRRRSDAARALLLRRRSLLPGGLGLGRGEAGAGSPSPWSPAPCRRARPRRPSARPPRAPQPRRS